MLEALDRGLGHDPVAGGQIDRLAKLVRPRPEVHAGTLAGDHAQLVAFQIALDRVAGGGLAARDKKPLSWFTIAGKDGEFVEAKAEIDGETVVVSSESVAKPTTVRFGWNDSAEPNLMNKEGLPASPFQSTK